MSVYSQLRPRLPLPRPRPVFSRGIRLNRRAVGDEATKWLSGSGLKYKDANHYSHGSNWLGGDHPFPMNPSFKPAPPISDETKNEIYNRYMSNPEKFNVRVLSGAYGISFKRIDAILRLKGLERSWEKNKQLQTGFVAGMEAILGTTDHVIGAIPPARKDVTAADMQDQDEANDRARDRYQRLFWEPVADNESPVVTPALERAKLEAKKAREESAQAKSDPMLLFGREPRGEDKLLTSKAKLKVVEGKNNSPRFKFIDVGGKFIDVEDRRRRIHEAQRRKEARTEERGT